MNERRDKAVSDNGSPQWNYAPPKWFRVSLMAGPFALFSEVIALLIAVEPHTQMPTARGWGIVFCMCIPLPLVWLRNGNKHLKNLAAHKEIDPALLKLISYFAVGAAASTYMLIAFLIVTLFNALRLLR